MTSIRIRVNDEFVLNAGTQEMVLGARGGEQVVHPPALTMFRQIVAYLRTTPAPSPPKRRSDDGVEGLAATSVALRWGSYLAVLFDHDKPVSADSKVGVSRISNEEMARINIEASGALAGWIDLMRTDFAESRACRSSDRVPTVGVPDGHAGGQPDQGSSKPGNC